MSENLEERAGPVKSIYVFGIGFLLGIAAGYGYIRSGDELSTSMVIKDAGLSMLVGTLATNLTQKYSTKTRRNNPLVVGAAMSAGVAIGETLTYMIKYYL